MHLFWLRYHFIHNKWEYHHTTPRYIRTCQDVVCPPIVHSSCTDSTTNCKTCRLTAWKTACLSHFQVPGLSLLWCSVVISRLSPHIHPSVTDTGPSLGFISKYTVKFWYFLVYLKCLSLFPLEKWFCNCSSSFQTLQDKIFWQDDCWFNTCEVYLVKSVSVMKSIWQLSLMQWCSDSVLTLDTTDWVSVKYFQSSLHCLLAWFDAEKNCLISHTFIYLQNPQLSDYFSIFSYYYYYYYYYITYYPINCQQIIHHYPLNHFLAGKEKYL